MHRIHTALLLSTLSASAFALPDLSFQTEQAFPNLTFNQPILLLEAPDDSDRIFVLERPGIIKVFPNNQAAMPGDVSVYLDITDRVTIVRDFALNGFDFHPAFATNGEIYVHYNWKNGADQTDLDYGAARISRFTATNPADNSISAATEEILHQHRKTKLPAEAKPLQDHNGGTIAFGPDGMLYVVFGDGGSDPSKLNTDPEGQDPLGNAQNTELFLGKIIRIDVTAAPDLGLGYHIPTDNPFHISGPAGASTLKEIWAYGLRNPWRFSFDFDNGHLFAVDVGAKSREEVNLIEAGNNYGWRLLEGTECFPSPPAPAICDPTGLTPPIVEHLWSNGEFRSLTGGYVYKGPGATQLADRFLYGDYVWGGVWAMSYDGSTASSTKIVDTTELIAGFGQDRSGEVYLLGYISGSIFRFKADSAIFPTASNDTLNAAETIAANDQLMATDVVSVAGYVIVTQPTNGMISLTAATGEFVYTAENLTANGTDSFVFKAIDGDGNDSNLATVSINITATNDAPALTGSLAGTLALAETILDIEEAAIGANDADSDETALIFRVSTAPAHGAIKVSGTPATQFTLDDIQSNRVDYEFTGNASLVGADSFQLTVEDESASATSPAQFNVTITQPTSVQDWMYIQE